MSKMNNIDLENVRIILSSKRYLDKFRNGGILSKKNLLRMPIENLERLKEVITKQLDDEELGKLKLEFEEIFTKHLSPDTNILPLYGKYIKDEYPLTMEEGNKNLYIRWSLGKRNNNWARFQALDSFRRSGKDRSKILDIKRRLGNTSKREIFSDKIIPYSKKLEETFGVLAITRDLRFVRYYFNRETGEMLPEYKDEPDNIDKLI